ncbi:MAG: thioredoxin-disulfide reductase [Lachnospiraceae bacterium]|nr:thioredoxin-disulfide reductase [Lachnospiraceae bacterium]
MYDIIIVGAGPAGLSAGIYALRSGKSALILEAKAYGGQIINTPDIENYPGIKNISGFEFATGLYEQATSLGAEVKYEQVISIEDKGDIKIVGTEENLYECKAVILATGAKNRKLGLEKENELIGYGVSYCATCDGAFYKNKDVAVVGGGNTAIEDALFLTNYCNKVYVIHRRNQFRADPKDVDKLKEKENVEFVMNSTVEKILGDTIVEGIEVKDQNTKEKKTINVSGVFIAVGQEPDNTMFSNLVKLDDSGYIIAKEDCMTNVKGIYTAGDCRTKTVRQLTTAAADGAVAALAACSIID